MEKVFEKLERVILYTIIATVPIAVLPVSPNPYVVTKLIIVSTGLVLYLLAKALKTIASGKLTFSVSKYDLAVFVIGVSYFASALLVTPNKMDAFLLPGIATMFISGSVFYFALNQLNSSEKKTVQTILAISAGVFAFISMVAFIGIYSSMEFLPAYMRAKTFTPEGGYLPAAIFTFVALLLTADLFFTTKSFAQKIIAGVCSVLIFFGLGLSIFNLLPGKDTSVRLPSTSISWGIAVDALKESPVLGIGPGNYVSAFNLYRSREYNTTNIWAVKFSTGTNMYLTTLTEAGLVGIAGFVLMLLVTYRAFRKMVEHKGDFMTKGGFIFLALVSLLVLGFFFPFSQLSLYMLFILLALTSKSKEGTLNLSLASSKDSQPLGSKIPAIIITVPLFLVVGYYALTAPRIILAEYRFARGVDAFANNKARETFDYMASAINTNNQVDRYHSVFSRVNLLVARNIIAQAEGGELSEAQRNDLSRLVQQAIAESRAAVVLNPLRSGNWDNLAKTYQAIIPLAKGADEFAIQSYRQAIVLDPLNPNLRIALGGLYYAKEDYQNAVGVFQLAVAVKPDLANAHFNLAYALSKRGQEGDIDAAITEMTTVLSLLDPQTSDYETARTALEQLQEQKSLTGEQQPSENLVAPDENANEPVIDPQLDLPEGSEPPEVQEVPDDEENTGGNESVSPTETPVITPTPTS